MRNVADDVKNRDFSPVYLIYGDEGYLRENYKNALIKALVAPGDRVKCCPLPGPCLLWPKKEWCS